MIHHPDSQNSPDATARNIAGGFVWMIVLFVSLGLVDARAEEFIEVSKSWTEVREGEEKENAESEVSLEWVEEGSQVQQVEEEQQLEETKSTAALILEKPPLALSIDVEEVSAEWEVSVLEKADVVEVTEVIPPPKAPKLTVVESIAQELALPSESIGLDVADDIDAPNNTGFVIDDSVPAGFEALAGPQTNFVDIYFNERKAGSTTITGTDETFVFDTPEEVLKMLGGIKKPDELALLLAMSFASNAHLICYRMNDPIGCGQVEANPIAMLYNPSELKVDIFLSSQFQEVLSGDAVKYLPAAASKKSAIASFNAVVTDLQGEASTLDFSSGALAGYGNGHLSAEFDYNTRSNRKRLRELKLSHFFRKHELELGSYAYQPGGALTDFSLLGASLSSTLKTRVDLEHAFSSELVVYLTRRSVVQLLVKDQIYSGESYPAGNQVLDTRALPEGSYEVEIRILDPVAGERTELRVFTKSTQIPPRGEWVYNATAGVPLIYNDDYVYPELADTIVVGGTVARRLTDASASKLGVLQLGNRSFLQSEYLYLGRDFAFQAAATIGEDRTLATSLIGSYSKDSINAGASLDTFQSDATVTEDSEFFDVYQDNYQQLGLSLGKSFKSYYLGLRSSHRKQTVDGNDISSNQYALSYRRPLFNEKSVRGYLDVSYQKDEIERQLLMQLRVFFQKNQWTHALSGEVYNGEVRGSNHRLGAETHWQSKDLKDFDVDVGAYASRSEDNNAHGVAMDVQHSLFSAGLSSDWNRDAGGQYQQNNIASASAHLGLDGRGVAIGGRDFAQAGIIISVKGEPAGERFEIVINGAKASVGQIGVNQFIGLQPFETYRIKLVPKTVLTNGLGDDSYEFTLYPGNVQRIDLTIERKVLLIASLEDESGSILDEGVIEIQPNPQLLSTDGILQAEVSPGRVLRVRRADGRVCEFTVPDGGEDSVLVMDEALICRAVVEPSQAE